MYYVVCMIFVLFTLHCSVGMETDRFSIGTRSLHLFCASFKNQLRFLYLFFFVGLSSFKLITLDDFILMFQQPHPNQCDGFLTDQQLHFFKWNSLGFFFVSFGFSNKIHLFFCMKKLEPSKSMQRRKRSRSRTHNNVAFEGIKS